MELVLEPNNFPPALASQKALYDGGFPATIFTTNDIAAEYKRLMSLGVKFREEPKRVGQTQTISWEWRPEDRWLPLCDRIARRDDESVTGQ